MHVVRTLMQVAHFNELGGRVWYSAHYTCQCSRLDWNLLYWDAARNILCLDVLTLSQVAHLNLLFLLILIRHRSKDYNFMGLIPTTEMK